jgi:Flp pilus assembly protein TadD
VLNLHLRPSGKPETVAPAIGLYFTSEAPRLHPMLVQLEHDGALDIPAGAKRFVVTDEYVLPVGVDLLGIYPHAHYLGKDLEATATLPDGTRRSLIHIPDWDVNWQGVYRYREPPFLPKGTTLSMRWSYDNSAENVRNPSQPPRRVRGGNRAEDEMAHLWLQLLPRENGEGKNDPRLLLQEALMRRRLVKYPGDFTAHCNLGAALEAQGRLGEAVRELLAAVHANPEHASARNTLGSAFEAQGRRDLAAREYRETLRIDPGYASAHYNLGRLTLAAGRTDEAIEHLRAVLRKRPDDADACNNLGSALAMKGDPAGAARAFERALEIDPTHAAATANLARVRAQLKPNAPG